MNNIISAYKYHEPVFIKAQKALLEEYRRHNHSLDDLRSTNSKLEETNFYQNLAKGLGLGAVMFVGAFIANPAAGVLASAAVLGGFSAYCHQQSQQTNNQIHIPTEVCNYIYQVRLMGQAQRFYLKGVDEHGKFHFQRVVNEMFGFQPVFDFTPKQNNVPISLRLLAAKIMGHYGDWKNGLIDENQFHQLATHDSVHIFDDNIHNDVLNLPHQPFNTYFTKVADAYDVKTQKELIALRKQCIDAAINNQLCEGIDRMMICQALLQNKDIVEVLNTANTLPKEPLTDEERETHKAILIKAMKAIAQIHQETLQKFIDENKDNIIWIMPQSDSK